MNLLFWNSGGTGAKTFLGLVREITRKHNLDILVILETRSSGDRAKRIAHSLGFDNVLIVDAQSYSGRLWVLWRNATWICQILHAHEQFIHFCITDGQTKCFYTTVYASPNPIKRLVMWHALMVISNTIDGSWCLGGDFNSTLFMHERVSRSRTSVSIDRDFSQWFSNLELIDLGSKGPFFTWKRDGCESHLDRIVVNNIFLQNHFNATVFHLSYFKLDHRPVLL